jgi:ABC-2 type transport system permease protein
MNKMLLVLRQEVLVTVLRPSFLFGLFGLPLLGVLAFTVISHMNQNQSTAGIVAQIMTDTARVESEGYIDQSGLIKSLPEDIASTNVLIAYPDEAAALQALDQGKIAAYYVVPADYLQTGQIIYNRPDLNPLSASGQSGTFEWVLKLNLLGGDTELAFLTYGPKDLQKVSLASEPERDQNNMLSFWLPYAVTLIFYMVIMSAASLLLSSVAKEKENRVMEILMVSVTPRQLLTGKIVGLGLVGLLQTVIYVGTGRALLSASTTAFNLDAAFQLPLSFLVWALVFFLLGYAVYASLMAGLGALVPNLREASQATMVVVFPLIIPLFLISVMIDQPNGPVAMILSLIPFTAPVTMMLRLSAASVPWWQPALSALILLVTAFFIIRAVAGMFRAQTLLSGQQFSVKLYLRALFGKS